jgi:probable rRNA maturation factor
LSRRPVAIANLHPRLRLDRRAIARAIRALDRHQAALAVPGSVLANAGELSLVFLTDGALAGLHGKFLDDPAPTDVITFPPSAARGPGGGGGEICVSADAAARRLGPRTARKREFSREITLYLVHGWLHLAGHDDLHPEKKRAMRRAEARAMKILEAASLVPEFSFKVG